MFPYLFPLASPSLPPSLSHPSRWSQSTELKGVLLSRGERGGERGRQVGRQTRDSDSKQQVCASHGASGGQCSEPPWELGNQGKARPRVRYDQRGMERLSVRFPGVTEEDVVDSAKPLWSLQRAVDRKSVV